MKKKTRYQRVLLKLSGEALQGASGSLDATALDQLSEEVIEATRLGVQVALVVGAGNWLRGGSFDCMAVERVTADQMGMLATVMNALAVRDNLIKKKQTARVFSAFPLGGVAPQFNREQALDALESGAVVLLAGGTGNPLVTTDTAASLRGIELQADILLKATQVDGVYSSDPKKDAHAHRFDHLSYDDVLEQELGVMDLAAFCQCRDHGLPIRVFNGGKAGLLTRILQGEQCGTLIGNEVK